MTTRPILLAAICTLAVAGGCGDDDGPPSSKQTTAPTDASAVGTTAPTTPTATLALEDKRGVALACIRDEKGIDARPIGAKGIQIGDTGGPRIDFFQSSLEAEGEQFEGRAEGAEQIGAALLYVREAPEQLLLDLEACLNEQ